MSPGTVVTNSGIKISAVFRGTKPCGVVLYHIPDGRKIRIPFGNEYRFGSLYCASISPLDPAEWGYRLYTGDTEFIDPASRSIIRLCTGSSGASADDPDTAKDSAAEEIRIGGFFYECDDRLPSYRKVSETGEKDERLSSFVTA